MNGKRARELRQLSGYVKPGKVPTEVAVRAHTWTVRRNPDTNRVEIRPSRIGRHRYGITDMGWRKPSAYLTFNGKIRKGVRP